MIELDFRIFGFQFIAYYFLFYILGYCIHRYSFLQIDNGYLLTMLTLLWTLLAWFWNMHELPQWMPVISYVPTAFVQYAYRGFTAFVAILVIHGFSPKVLNGEGDVNMFVKEIGVISLGIYVCHLSFMGFVVNFLRHEMPDSSKIVYITYTFIISFVLSLIIVRLLKRKKWVAMILLGKI